MTNISVIMSVYNEDIQGMKIAIESILNQTYNDFEFIIILDSPSNEVGNNYILNLAKTESKIKIIRHEVNQGLGKSLNEGIKMATGIYIARQDTEDFSYPDRLKKQYEYLELNKEIGIVGSWIKFVDEKSKALLIRKYNAIVGEEIKLYNPIAHPTLMIRKSVFLNYGFYNDNLYDDYDLWIRFYLQGVLMRNIQEVLVDYYQEEATKIKKAKNELLHTITCKNRHKENLQFGVREYIYIMLEKSLSLFPSWFIVKLFYVFQNLSNKKNTK